MPYIPYMPYMPFTYIYIHIHVDYIGIFHQSLWDGHYGMGAGAWMSPFPSRWTTSACGVYGGLTDCLVCHG